MRRDSAEDSAVPRPLACGLGHCLSPLSPTPPSLAHGPVQPCFDSQRVWGKVFGALNDGQLAEADKLEAALRKKPASTEVRAGVGGGTGGGGAHSSCCLSHLPLVALRPFSFSAFQDHQAKLFSFENGEWRHSAGAQRAWDHHTDVYEYQSEAQHHILSIDDVATRQHSNSGAGPPVMRQGSRPDPLPSVSEARRSSVPEVRASVRVSARVDGRQRPQHAPLVFSSQGGYSFAQALKGARCFVSLLTAARSARSHRRSSRKWPAQ